MIAYAYPAFFALFVWWFSTGAIIFLDGLPRATFKWSMLGATVVLGLSLYGLYRTAGDGSLWGAYAAFTFGLLAWGWQEMSFYMGYVTGPRKDVCPDGCSGWPHFVHAVQTSLWHELSIVACAGAVVWLTWNGANQIGTWTFMILWWMHQSAKLNVFLGVRNLNEEFLPEHLTFLKAFLTKRPMNLLFPFSVTISTVINVLLVQAAIAPSATPFQAAGFTFLAMLMALAVLEHWFLVLPLPSAKLWQWGLASRGTQQPFDVDLAVGFLGAGKTTFLRRMLDEADASVRTVALVNDFAELGIDASLLKGHGAQVVELANGCICCSLRQDLARQLQEMVVKYAPQRVIIEPSGVADIASLLAVLNRPGIVETIRDLRVYTLIDAGAFLRDYARMKRYFEVQAGVSRLFVVNKVDVVGPAEIRLVEATLGDLNPAARIVRARFGEIVDGRLDLSQARVPVMGDTAALQGAEPAPNALQVAGAAIAQPRASASGHANAHSPSRVRAHDHDHEEHPHMLHHADAANDHEHHDEFELGLESWSAQLDKTCDIEALDKFLQTVSQGGYGRVERLKGIVEAPSGWLRFDVAGGRSSILAFSPAGAELPRIMTIGRDVDRNGLMGGLAACAAK